jgi:hypothetical protein
MSTYGTADLQDSTGDRAQNLTSAAAAVAYAGALPLLIGAILAWARPDDLGPRIVELMALYGITLLAFFGGVRWGVAVMARQGPTFRQLAGSVVPLVLGFGLLLVDDLLARLVTLAVVMPLLLWDDLRATRRGSGAPGWYLSVRLPLTAMMELSILAALFWVMTHA